MGLLGVDGVGRDYGAWRRKTAVLPTRCHPVHSLEEKLVHSLHLPKQKNRPVGRFVCILFNQHPFRLPNTHCILMVNNKDEDKKVEKENRYKKLVHYRQQ